MIYRADWVLPIAGPPLADAWVETDGTRVTAVGTGPVAEAVDLGHVAILPALVNAHTHLELSHLAGRVPPAASLPDWVRALLVERDLRGGDEAAIAAAGRAAIATMRRAGIGLVGDVSNTLATVPWLVEAGLAAEVFYELIGFRVADPDGLVREARHRVEALPPRPDDRVRVALAPHAPYSVSRALFAALRADLDAAPARRSMVHLAESLDEIELLATGTGRWRAVLEDFGMWRDDWVPPAVSPVAYLSDLGFLDSRVAAVHGTQCNGPDLDRLRALDVSVVVCPRSNQHVGAGSPPLEALYAMDVPVAFGTDSLASAPTLSVFDELAEACTIAPQVPAGRLLDSATRGGARALGRDDELGTIEPGRLARLIVVRVPPATDDVEQYLVSAVAPDAVAWLDETPDPES